jgi:hypothetical protein
LFAAQPQRALDAGIERLGGVVIVHGAAEGEAQEAAPIVGVAPEVHANQGFGRQAPRGFLACLADHRFDESFRVFEMARGLIEHQAAGDAFLDHEETALALHDGGHGDVRIRSHG